MEVKMNTWIIVGILVGLFVVGGIAVASAFSPSQNTDTVASTASCTSCGGKCSAGSNCGLATCGATNGGKCGCGRG